MDVYMGIFAFFTRLGDVGYCGSPTKRNKKQMLKFFLYTRRFQLQHLLVAYARECFSNVDAQQMWRFKFPSLLLYLYGWFASRWPSL